MLNNADAIDSIEGAVAKRHLVNACLDKMHAPISLEVIACRFDSTAQVNAYDLCFRLRYYIEKTSSAAARVQDPLTGHPLRRPFSLGVKPFVRKACAIGRVELFLTESVPLITK
jgi:hypothetical protein